MSEIEQRLQRLEDERAILAVLYAYGHGLDYGHEQAYLDCWTEDAVLYWPDSEMHRGREAIGQAFRAHTHAPDAYHKHILVEPQIVVDGDRATASSMYMRVDSYPDGPKIRSFGRYVDVLVRCKDGRWRFQERRTEREAKLPGVR